MNSFQLAFEAIGTRWVIDCFNSSKTREEILKIISDRIEEFDKTYSRFRKDSIVWKISEKKGEYKFPHDSKELFSLYEKLELITNSAFTLLIGNTLVEAGYDSEYKLAPGEINKLPKSSEIYSFKFPVLTITKPFVLDFGGLGKGYLIDIIAKLLLENNINTFTIDGGGDIYYKNDEKTLSVGLEHPGNFKQVIGIAKIKNQSIAASSGNRRAWDRFHHIIDANSLKSPDKILATWVVSRDAVTADGLATCLFFASPEKLLKYFDFEYLILYPDYSFKKSKNFPAELFIQKENLVQ
ncbi:MAG: FAD:protein FMN transferase [Candidatus Levybacteria bacterium]|nr:FAD:protein FMN transferase [Candidatus Levybacteria bacterium]